MVNGTLDLVNMPKNVKRDYVDIKQFELYNLFYKYYNWFVITLKNGGK